MVTPAVSLSVILALTVLLAVPLTVKLTLAPLYLASVLVAVWAIGPLCGEVSATISSTALTVTVCGKNQLAGVKLRPAID